MKNFILAFFLILFFIASLALIDTGPFILILTSIYSILICIILFLILLFFIFNSLHQKSYIPLQNLAITLVFLLIISGVYSLAEAFSSPTFSLVVLLALPLEIFSVAYYLGLYYGINKLIVKNDFNIKYFSLILFVIALPVYLLNIFLAIPI